MKYSVKYKLQGQWFFRKIKNVTADFWLSEFTRSTNGEPNPYPARVHVFMTDKEERFEIPKDGTVFRFSVERFQLQKEQTNQAAKQKII